MMTNRSLNNQLWRKNQAQYHLKSSRSYPRIFVTQKSNTLVHKWSWSTYCTHQVRDDYTSLIQDMKMTSLRWHRHTKTKLIWPNNFLKTVLKTLFETILNQSCTIMNFARDVRKTNREPKTRDTRSSTPDPREVEFDLDMVEVDLNRSSSTSQVQPKIRFATIR
jgi:hypothetical protein